MQQAPDRDGQLPPSLRWLKALVFILTLTTIGGVITVVAVIVTRMPKALTAPVTVPEALALPEGTRAAAFTQAKDWLAVVTEDGRLLIFERDGTFRQEVRISAPKP